MSEAEPSHSTAGLVVPDIPLEETGPLRELTTQNGMELVLLTTPTTPLERAKAIAEATQGFLYLVGRPCLLAHTVQSCSILSSFPVQLHPSDHQIRFATQFMQAHPLTTMISNYIAVDYRACQSRPPT